MKLTLIGLLILSLTPWSTSYCQTDDSLYCLPLWKARQVVSAALRGQLADSLLSVADSRIVLLESEKQASFSSFTKLLQIEQDKYKTAVEKSGELQKINQSFQQQLSGVQKRERGHKREKVALGGALVVVIVLALVK